MRARRPLACVCLLHLLLVLALCSANDSVHVSTSLRSRATNAEDTDHGLFHQDVHQALTRISSGNEDIVAITPRFPSSSSTGLSTTSTIRSHERSFIVVDGTSNMNLNRRSLLSTLPSSGKYPWFTLIFKIKDSKYFYTGCAGSLISSQFVLTSTHCFNSSYHDSDDDAVEWAVWIGALTSEPGNGGQFSEVIKIEDSYLQKDLDFDSFEKDCALIKLKTNSTIDPVNVTGAVTARMTEGKCSEGNINMIDSVSLPILFHRTKWNNIPLCKSNRGNIRFKSHSNW